MIRSHLVRSLYENLLGPRYGNTELIEEPFLKYEMGILNSSMVTTEEKEDAQPALDSEINPDPADVDAEALPDSKPGAEVQDFDIFRQEVDTDLSFKTGAVSLGLHFVLKGDAAQIQDMPHMGALRTGQGVWRRSANVPKTTQLLRDRVDLCEFEGHKKRVGKQHQRKRSDKPRRLSARDQTQDQEIKRVDSEGISREQNQVCEEPERGGIGSSSRRSAQCQMADQSCWIWTWSTDSRRMRSTRWRNYYTLNYRTKARGYMCAAVWDEVDPEVEPNGEIGSLSWSDCRSVPEAVRKEFYPSACQNGIHATIHRSSAGSIRTIHF